jgi:AhpD family alkylhydroperoxidase
MSIHQHLLEELRQPTRSLRAVAPGVLGAFTELHAAAMADGALSTRTKELMALAISVTSDCQDCIAFHARGAHRAGATGEEVADALGVAIMMGGGPARMTAPRAWAAFQEVADHARDEALAADGG